MYITKYSTSYSAVLNLKTESQIQHLNDTIGEGLIF